MMRVENKTNLPRHLAIIMDGNGRWAQERGLPRIYGHREGVKNLRRIVTACSNLGIEVLTLYAFSAENWTRPRLEVELLMKLLKIYAVRERRTFREHHIRLQTIGDLSRLPASARKALETSIEKTSTHTGMRLQLALSYGGRDEILRATRKIAEEVEVGRLKPAEISEEIFSDHLDTKKQPDPDLIVRTSGENRLSNFLLWQGAYAEFYISDLYWPDFNEVELERAFDAFRRRERRFGGVLASGNH